MLWTHGCPHLNLFDFSEVPIGEFRISGRAPQYATPILISNFQYFNLLQTNSKNESRFHHLVQGALGSREALILDIPRYLRNSHNILIFGDENSSCHSPFCRVLVHTYMHEAKPFKHIYIHYKICERIIKHLHNTYECIFCITYVSPLSDLDQHAD